MASFFRQIDSPYMAMSTSSMGPPILAAKTSTRRAKPRERVTVIGRPGWRDIPAGMRLSGGLV
jgi:hypothetical protein